MELHIVMFKKQYGTFSNALEHSDGLTVLAFFFIISQKANSAYVEISQNLKRIVKAQTSTNLSYPLSLGDYVHEDVDEYFAYNGSLTTPPCLEVLHK
jgi:carbonic anhydrase